MTGFCQVQYEKIKPDGFPKNSNLEWLRREAYA